jgi:hypothetical protein
MLAFLAAATLTVIGVGWYLDWFHLRSVPADAGHRSWTVDMNTEKIGRDLIDAEKKVKKKLAEKNSSSADDAKPSSVAEPAAESTAPTDPPVKPAVGAALRKLEGFIDQPDR